MPKPIMVWRPRIAVLVAATAIDVGGLCHHRLVRAAGDALPAQGTLKVVNSKILNDAAICQLAKGVLINRTAMFDATLQWHDDGVAVASGDFSCSLKGKQALSGDAPCRFFVGGGKARTAIECPAKGLSGQRQNDSLNLRAADCRATALGCDLAADLSCLSFLSRNRAITSLAQPMAWRRS